MQKISFDKIVDLSYNVDENSPRELPIDPVNIYHTATIEKDGYFESRVDLSGHCSTHIDAPCLMYKNGFTVADIPIEKLFGRSVLIDLSENKRPGDAITAEDLQKWEQDNIEIKTDDIVFLRTGMDERVDQDIFNRKWIGFSKDGASFLTEKGIKTIGTDACSIDSPAGHELAPEVLPPAHLVFLGAGIPQIEDLRNLNQLPQIFFVTIAPLKLSRSSGAPTRVFAFV